MRPLLLLTALVIATATHGQDIFGSPSNLEVLPEDISSTQLRSTMRLFAMATGSRCESCHVGEAGAPLTTFDFASDEKKRKQVAREMLRMTNTINEEFVDKLDQPRTAVTCMTCHRGVQRPRTTIEELRIASAGGDPAAGLARYRELREAYYGSHSYDFTERVLNDFAQEIAASDPAAAGEIVEANLEYFPESLGAYVLLGRTRSLSGEIDGAREALEKALSLAEDEGMKRYVESQIAALPE